MGGIAYLPLQQEPVCVLSPDGVGIQGHYCGGLRARGRNCRAVTAKPKDGQVDVVREWARDNGRGAVPLTCVREKSSRVPLVCIHEKR